MKTEIIDQAELRRVGHFALLKVLPPEADKLQLTIEQAIGAGILATLLRIAEGQSETQNTLQDIAKHLSRLVGIQNMAAVVEEL